MTGSRASRRRRTPRPTVWNSASRSTATNDPVRGEGTFERAMAGVSQLLRHGFLPIITVARTADEQDDADLFAGFVAMLRARGYTRPRVKILPTLRLGAEVTRRRGYAD